MCGLFGWNVQPEVVHKYRVSLRALAISLMFQNDKRGGDSWGYFGVRDGIRRVGIGDMTEMSKKSLKALCRQETAICHTRKATAGGISHENCHPFSVGKIVGAHNGIVYNHRELNVKYERDCKVDSEHIFCHLSGDMTLEDIEAYGAIAFHDRQQPDKPIFLARFNGGELEAAHIQGVGTVWSSDGDHLEKALSLAGWEPKNFWKLEANVVYHLADDYHLLHYVNECPISSPRYVSTADRTATGSKGYYNNWENEDDRYDWRYHTSSSSTSPPPSPPPTPTHVTDSDVPQLEAAQSTGPTVEQADIFSLPTIDPETSESESADSSVPTDRLLTEADLAEADKWTDRDWAEVMNQ